MSLPMRPSPSPRASPPDHPHSTSNSAFASTQDPPQVSPSLEHASTTHSHHSALDFTHTQPPTSRTSTAQETMCAPLVDSSPLSSAPPSPAGSPPPSFPAAVPSTIKTDSAGADALPAVPGAYPDSPTSVTSDMSKKRARRNNGDTKPKASPAKKATTGKTRASTKASAAPAVTRPARNRKAPVRYLDYKVPAKVSKPAPTRKPAGSRVFDPVYATTNTNSRLGKADIYHMLLLPDAWSSLTTEQQHIIISMLPENRTNGALLGKLSKGETVNRPKEFTLSYDCFRTDVAKFQADLTNGHLAKTWLAAAEQAVIQRHEGIYDDWKMEEAEEWWGQKG